MDNIMDSLVANEEDKKIEKLAVTLDIFVSSELRLPTVIYDKATDLRNELIRYLEHISNYEPKTEQQTCDTCRFDDRYGDESICKECARHYSDNYAPIEDEPQTERSNDAE